jgi:hypothetical protein
MEKELLSIAAWYTRMLLDHRQVSVGNSGGEFIRLSACDCESHG